MALRDARERERTRHAGRRPVDQRAGSRELHGDCDRDGDDVGRDRLAQDSRRDPERRPRSPRTSSAPGASTRASGTTATDASGRGNTGTISGPARTTAGQFGGALSFDGVNDWVTIPDANTLDLTTGMTMEAWVRPSAVGSLWRAVMIKEQPSNLIYALYAGDGGGRAGGAHLHECRPRRVRHNGDTPQRVDPPGRDL